MSPNPRFMHAGYFAHIHPQTLVIKVSNPRPKGTIDRVALRLENHVLVMISRPNS